MGHTLWIVVPCYNEQEVLPVTVPIFLKKLSELVELGKISSDSKLLLVNDGSRDNTWELIRRFAKEDSRCIGISQSRNRGHQNALLAGLTEARERCDAAISIDCDGQDDIDAMNAMVDAWLDGCDIVYGVRNDRAEDTFFKRFTAESFYRAMRLMGAEVVFNHADYRLLSSRVLNELSRFGEVNIFLRGMIPLIGFKSTCVPYKRSQRIAGKSHYPLRKMLHLAWDGITSLSVKPIRIVTGLGALFSMVSFIGVIWALITYLCGRAVSGWASMICVTCFIGGIQLLSLGIIGEYVGKVYLETKHRPRYIISEKTYTDSDNS